MLHSVGPPTYWQPGLYKRRARTVLNATVEGLNYTVGLVVASGGLTPKEAKPFSCGLDGLVSVRVNHRQVPPAANLLDGRPGVIHVHAVDTACPDFLGAKIEEGEAVRMTAD